MVTSSPKITVRATSAILRFALFFSFELNTAMPTKEAGYPGALKMTSTWASNSLSDLETPSLIVYRNFCLQECLIKNETRKRGSKKTCDGQPMLETIQSGPEIPFGDIIQQRTLIYIPLRDTDTLKLK